MERILRQCRGQEQLIFDQTQEIRRLRRLLEDVGLPPGGGHAAGGYSDPVGMEVVRREALIHEIEAFSAEVDKLKMHMAKVQRLMLRVLNDDERTVVRLRCLEKNRWNAVARKAAICRSTCFSTYFCAMEKLAEAWGE